MNKNVFIPPAFKPELFFRGNRDYLHSTTLFDAFRLYAEKLTDQKLSNVDYTFNTKTEKMIEIVDFNNTPSKVFVATFITSNIQLGAVELKQKISNISDYDENVLLTKFSSSHDRIILHQPYDEFSFIDHLIYGFKTLTLKHSKNKKPAFARLKLAFIPERDTMFEVSYSRLINKRFHEGVVYIENKAIGKIYFGSW